MKSILKISSIPILGAFLEAVGMIIEKKILRKKKIDFREYNSYGFLAIILLLIPIIIILNLFYAEKFPILLSSLAFSSKSLLILVAIIIISALANLFIFYALKWEKITELEPLRLLQPLFSIILAFFIISAERTLRIDIIIVSLIASAALVFSHLRKHHLSFNKYAISAILGSLFFALELILTNLILPYYPPLVFYFIRCLGICILSFAIFRPKIETIDRKSWKLIFGVSFLWIVYRLLLYSSYLAKGVITTTLLFMLTPVFIYLMSYFYLHEKPNWRNIAAAIIIVACVGYAMLV